MALQLENALLGKKELAGNPFVFFSSSLLNVIQHAHVKDKKESKVRISCIDTRTASTPAALPALFRAVPQVMEELGIEPLTAGWTYLEMDFSDVYVTSDIVIPGVGSSFISLKQLQDCRFYDLYPALGMISRRGNPGLETPLRDLRDFWYEAEQDLSYAEINLAVQLAIAFQPVKAVEDPYVPGHLFSWFLAFKAQSLSGDRFGQWLDAYSEPRVHEFLAESSIRATGIRELDHYALINNKISKRCIRVDEVESLRSAIRCTCCSEEVTWHFGGIYQRPRFTSYGLTHCHIKSCVLAVAPSIADLDEDSAYYLLKLPPELRLILYEYAFPKR